jgi:hypothetical protein
MSNRWKYNYWLGMDRLRETAADPDMTFHEDQLGNRCDLCDEDSTFYVQYNDAGELDEDALMLCDEHILIWGSVRSHVLKTF